MMAAETVLKKDADALMQEMERTMAQTLDGILTLILTAQRLKQDQEQNRSGGDNEGGERIS